MKNMFFARTKLGVWSKEIFFKLSGHRYVNPGKHISMQLRKSR
jgi:hypothetical protein